MEPASKDPSYARAKMSSLREGWLIADVRQISVHIPNEYRQYFTAMALILQGKALIDRLDRDNITEPDYELVSEFGNRRPRYSVTLEDVDEMRDSTNNESIKKECDRMEAFLKEARLQRAEGMRLLQEQQYSFGLERLAREYAYVTYTKGIHELCDYLNRGGVVPEIDASILEDGGDVL